MKNFIWIIYREVLVREDYFLNKDYEVEDYGYGVSYQDALEQGRKYLDIFCDDKLGLNIIEI